MPLNTETAVRRSRTRFAEATTGGYASIIATNSVPVKQTFFLFYSKYLGIHLRANRWDNAPRNRINLLLSLKRCGSKKNFKREKCLRSLSPNFLTAKHAKSAKKTF